MPQDQTRVFVYPIAQDTGFAPNPFHGVCTLATCKPDIRKAAKPGDFVIGKAKAPHGLRAVVVMEVNEILTFDEYWHDPKFACKKPRRNGDPIHACGDNIYHRSPDESWVQAPSFHDVNDIEHDTGKTQSVLVARNFTYFGAEGPDLPDLHGANLRRIRNMQYKFTNRNDRRKLDAWIGSQIGQGCRGMPSDFRNQGAHKGCGGSKVNCN